MKLLKEDIEIVKKRGRPPKIKEEIPIVQEINKRKFRVIHEHLDCTVVWDYNLDIFDRGPIEVNIKYKENIKELSEFSNSEKYIKRKNTKRRGRPKK